MTNLSKNSSSFRDPDGFIFEHQDEIYRNINPSYAKNFEILTTSGLLEKLWNEGLLIKHELVNDPAFKLGESCQTIKPKKIPIITYPYEWCFSQLKDAALLTLEVLHISIEHGMILKDASAFNVQFIGCNPVFIDTLSFEKYEEGQLWSGYRQFCEHFLAPLCLSSYLGASFLSLSRLGVDGIPLKMASKILPRRSWFNAVPLFHIHLHAKTIDHYAISDKSKAKKRVISNRNLKALIDHLKNYIAPLQLGKADKSQWQHYDKEEHYSLLGKQDKALIIKKFTDIVKPQVVWDMGANDGTFSRSISNTQRFILSLDSDPLAIEKNYMYAKKANDTHVYSLLFDIVNPSPNLGWANQERGQLSSRSTPDLILALALIHHLVITNNVPFHKVAEYFAGLTKWLIIEFIPKEDEKVKVLPETAGKKLYNRENFQFAFFSVFECVEEVQIAGSERSLMLLKKI